MAWYQRHKYTPNLPTFAVATSSAAPLLHKMMLLILFAGLSPASPWTRIQSRLVFPSEVTTVASSVFNPNDAFLR